MSYSLKSWLFILVGAGMALGFGWLGVGAVRDVMAFPSAPVDMTITAAAGLKSVSRGSWVRLRDLSIDCTSLYAHPSDGGSYYAIARSTHGDSRVVVAVEQPLACDELERTEMVGGLDARRAVGGGIGAGLPANLAFPDVDWATWPDGRVVLLWTTKSPANSRGLIWLMGGFSLLGALIVWFGVASIRRTEERQDAFAIEDPVLPFPVRVSNGPARQARRNGWILIACALASCLGIGGEMASAYEGTARVVLLLLFEGLGAGLFWLGVRALRRGGRLAEATTFPAETHWLPVIRATDITANGIHTGTVTYDLQLPAAADGQDPGKQTTQVSTTSVGEGLVFKDAARSAVLAVWFARTRDVVVLRTGFRELELMEDERHQALARLRPLPTS